MRKTVFLLLVITGSTYLHPVAASASPLAQNVEVAALIEKLATKSVHDGSAVVFKPPSQITRRQVRQELLRLAKRSTRGRALVVKALIKVLDDPRSRQDIPFADRWLTAVSLLGELRALEGIDALIRSLDFNGQNGIVMSISIHPACDALVNIGAPAVPKLIAALSNGNPTFRTEAAATLRFIGDKRAHGSP